MITRGAAATREAIVIDSSAILAVLTGEPSASGITAAIDRATTRLVAVATVLECSLVMQARYGPDGDLLLDELLRELSGDLIPMDATQLAVARDAARRFGRGRHRASLNFGDCITYALARQRALPVLCVGDDFQHTDIEVAAL